MHRTDYLIGRRCTGRVLELGCHDGGRGLAIAMQDNHVLSLDEDHRLVSSAQQNALACCLDNCCFRPVEEDRPDGQFDTIVMSSSSDAMRRVLFEQIDRALSPDGQVILPIPGSTHTLGNRNLTIAVLRALEKRLSQMFPSSEDIRDEFTEWRIFVFRRRPDTAGARRRPATMSRDAAPVPKVSVIMTTYNRGRLIRTAIESVLSQVHPNVELIVVNDGSEDNTGEILEAYGSRIVAIHQKNQGIAVATNAGLDVATGDFVQRFDDDDVMFPRKIDCQVKKFATNPALGLVYTGAYMQFSSGSRKEFRRMGRFIPLSQYALVPSIDILNSATLIRKQCMDEIGAFDTRLTGMAECDRFIRIMARHEYAYLPVPGVLYVKHGENHTIRKRKLIVESARRIQESMVDQVGIEDVFKDIAKIEDEDERRKRYSLAFLRRGEASQAKGCHASAIRDFERAVDLAPENMGARKRLSKAREALLEATRGEGQASAAAPVTAETEEEAIDSS